MMTRYELHIHAACPVDSERDVYECIIESDRTIPVERINEVVGGWLAKGVFQEDITQAIARQLGAKVTTIGYHSGVKTTCIA